ncbi:MAG TPA: pyrimidine 5'-nucleotidase [Sphingomonas sp.]|nr:pyrimidine 5'-nucleotidase [Sphingomonas sp.]
MPPELDPIRTWIFDLDNTLYPASADLFGRIDRRMTAYVARLLGVEEGEALAVQKRYFHEHGTTLSGLMAHHGVDPHDFLADVHAIELEGLAEDARLARLIAELPGRKLVFTNGDEPYARRVLGKLGLDGTFEAIHDIHACAYAPKPNPAAYAGFCARHAVDPAAALFVEDMARNLKPAKALGMTTVWLDNGSEQAPDADRGFIDYTITDLADWLHSLLENAA